jgi:hypothetical protein
VSNSGEIHLSAVSVTFTAESSTNAAEVDRILSWIRILPGRIAVPGYQRISMNEQGGGRAAYVRALKKAGLAAKIRSKKTPGVPPGLILAVSPAPGTMLRPGTAVTVTVVAERHARRVPRPQG